MIGAPLTLVHFPTSAIVSLVYVLEDGSSAEIAVVGSEGVVGIAIFMGGGSTPNRSVVQSAGKGYRGLLLSLGSTTGCCRMPARSEVSVERPVALTSKRR